MWLGLVAYKLSDYRTARSEGERSVVMKRSVGLDSELSRSYNALGLLAWNEGRYRDALRDFDSALVSARRNRDATGLARAVANIPLVKVELGDFEGARKGFETALAAGTAIRDERIIGNALTNQAMLDIRLGRAREALPLLSEARKHYDVIEYSPGHANALGQLATAYADLGDLQRALTAADSALFIARSEGNEQEVASDLEVIADLQAQAGNPRLALRTLQEADSVDAVLGLGVERGINLRRMSAILLDLGESPAAVARAREALAAHLKSEARAEAINDRLQLAQSLSTAGDLRLASAEAESAEQEAKRVASPALSRQAAMVVAILALAKKNPQRALNHLSGLDASSQTFDWRISDLRGQSLLALGRLEEARAHAERAVASLERERGSLGIGPLRSGYLASRSAPYSHLVTIHLARHDTASAFRVAASLPGRSLAERLGELGELSKSVENVAEGERLLLRVAALEQQISELTSAENEIERKTALDRKLEAAQAAYEAHLASQPLSADKKVLGLVSPTLKDVQSQLGPDDALLTFLSAPERLDEFLVTRAGVLHHSFPVSDRELGARVRAARDLMARGQMTESLAALGRLYDQLLRPLIDTKSMQGVSNLLIVPHASLGALPFAALWNTTERRFAVQDRSFSYLPTVAALAVVRPGINPTVTNRIALFAPVPDSLPGSRVEVESIARLFSSADLWVGSNASETVVRSALADGRSIHVASHGSHNAQNPLFSHLTVGSARGRDTRNDGQLEAYEILALATTSPLVFLSGCETGLGSAGEGLLAQGSDEGSLAQAFLVAGARNVVATLWRVNDLAAVAIAGSFYRHLRSGSRAADAIAAAQREAIQRRGDFTWAAYELSVVGPQISPNRP
jgi:CHAT domain-containing protein/predicted negative regulator of RcsB-dependent stress response